jgi:hypothetical protein
MVIFLMSPGVAIDMAVDCRKVAMTSFRHWTSHATSRAGGRALPNKGVSLPPGFWAFRS